MQEFMKNISDYFSGNSKAAANPDIAYNIELLDAAKRKIESGVFTKFFKRPTIILSEVLSYLAALLFIIVGAYFGGKIDLLLSLYQKCLSCDDVLQKNALTPDTIPFLHILLYIVCGLPTLIFFLLGRSLTQSRKRINAFMQVENMIGRISFNLKNEKKTM